MTTIVSSTVAACLDAFRVDPGRFARLSDTPTAISLGPLPTDQDILSLKFGKTYWSKAGLVPDDAARWGPGTLHMGDFIAILPCEGDERVLQIAQVKGFADDENMSVTMYSRCQLDPGTVASTANTRVINIKQIEVKCWVDNTVLPDTHFLAKTPISTCSLCDKERDMKRKAVDSIRRLRTISLCGGAGGTDIGLAMSHCRAEVMIDASAVACATFKKHHPKVHVLQMDIGLALQEHETLSNTTVDMLVMGPPCQPFSKASRKSREERAMDPRSLCVATGLSYVEKYRPAYGFIENVYGMLENGNLGCVEKTGVVKFIFQCLATLDYKVRLCVLESNAFGIPQQRKRIIFIFAKLNVTLPKAPLGHFSSRSRPGLYPAVSIRDALGDLPRWELKNPKRSAPRETPPLDQRPPSARPLSFSLQKDGQIDAPSWSEYGSGPQNNFQKTVRAGSGTFVSQHHTLPPIHSPFLTVERICHIPMRPKANHLSLAHISALAMPELVRTDDDKVFQNAFGRLDPDGLFPTVMTSIELRNKGGRMLMADQNRLPSIRELARAQGFPDGITFCGSSADMLQQIGNAVPIPLATALGDAVLDAVVSDFSRGDTRFARRAGNE